MADKGSIRGYSIKRTAAFIRSEHIDPAQREKILAVLPERLRGDMSTLDVAAWYPREDSATLYRAIASVANGEEEVHRLLTTCGEFIANESINTFLKLVMRLMTPVRFALKLPDFWKRDMQGGYFIPDVSRADENYIHMTLADVPEFDHIGPITEGWIRFCMRALGKTGVDVKLGGWSLENPGPERVTFEVRWA